jgi:HD-like signal output (HDOD) protein/ActR/RegA family two-component response regulator
MSDRRHRALIVDNEAAIGRLTVAALATHGFDCDVANDSDEAHLKLGAAKYDVVIVDWKIVDSRNQPLALELVTLANRPHIIVYTDRAEPKLAQELIGRGADGVLSKPFDYEQLAAKAQRLIEGKRATEPTAHAAAHGASPQSPAAAPTLTPATAPVVDERMSPEVFKKRLADVSHVLPISAAAIDVYEMTKNLDWDLSQIAAAVQRDASLTTEVLRMANSAYFNPPGRPIVDLDEAVMRIGQKRVGELALSINALSCVVPAKLPWLDLELLWNRSMAAGIALELIVDQGGHEEIAEGLFVSAIMHPLGRVVLGMLFPKQYSAMIAECGRTGAALTDIERRTFPASHADVMAQLLSDWRLAPEVFIPIKFSLDEYPAIARLLEPMRTKAQLVKVAMLLGRLAVGRWESWDLVRLPPQDVLQRLHIHDVDALLRQIRADVARLADFHPGGAAVKKKPAPAHVEQPIAYCNFANHEIDLVKALLPSLGLEPHSYESTDLRLFEEPLVANCLGVDAAHFAAHRTNKVSLIVAEEAAREEFAHFGTAVALPSSFSRLRNAVQRSIAANAEAAAAKLS